MLQTADCTAVTRHTPKDSQEPRITKIYVPGQHSSDQTHRSAVSQWYWLETYHSLTGKKSPHSAHCTTWAVSEITGTPDVQQPWLMSVPDSHSSHSNSTLRDALLSLLQHPRTGGTPVCSTASQKEQRCWSTLICHTLAWHPLVSLHERQFYYNPILQGSFCLQSLAQAVIEAIE